MTNRRQSRAIQMSSSGAEFRLCPQSYNVSNHTVMCAAADFDFYDQTVSDIYESALNPDHWEVALAGLINRSAPARWDVTFLIWETPNPPSGRFVGSIGVNDFARAGYLQFFAGQNPWSDYAHNLPVGTVVHSDALLPRAEFRDSALYQRFLSTWDIDTALIGVVDRAGGARLGLVLPGPDTGSTDALLSDVRRYVPHIQRASRISRKLGEANLRAENAELALEHSPGAIWVLGRDLTLQYANGRGQDFIGKGLARMHDGKLSLPDLAIQKKLSQLANGEHPEPSIAFSMEPEGEFVQRVLAMRIQSPTASILGSKIEGGAVLMVASAHNAGFDQQMLDRYIDWFGFTPTEARLAAMLATGSTLDDFARMRGVTVNAGRFLLKSIFEKTGVNKQPQLVALLKDAPDGWIQRNEALPAVLSGAASTQT